MRLINYLNEQQKHALKIIGGIIILAALGTAGLIGWIKWKEYARNQNIMTKQTLGTGQLEELASVTAALFDTIAEEQSVVERPREQSDLTSESLQNLSLDDLTSGVHQTIHVFVRYPGFGPVGALNGITQDTLAGKRLLLIFDLPNIKGSTTLFPTRYRIKKGNITFEAAKRRFVFFPGGRAVSYLEGQVTSQGMMLMHSGDTRFSDWEMYWTHDQGKHRMLMAILRAVPDRKELESGGQQFWYKYCAMELPILRDKRRYRAYLTVTFSPDFEGVIDDWKFFLPL